jgi:cation transport ATPase
VQRLALPIAGGIRGAGLTLRPEIAALDDGSSLLVALNALLLRRAKVT